MLRALLALSTVCGSLAAQTSFADAQADAAALVEKGLMAIGGRDIATKCKAATWKAQGTFYGMGAGVPYSAVYAVQWPGKFRMEIVDVFTLVLNDDKGWIKAGGEVREMTAEELAEQRENHYSSYVSTLVPLNDKAFKLSTTGETRVGQRPALGVNVAREGHRDVQLYFDKENGRLVKSEARVKAPELGGQEVTQEVFFEDYRAVDGIQVPHKMVVKRDGKQFVEGEDSEVKHHEKLDDGQFGKP
jgi:hypothetical protein